MADLKAALFTYLTGLPSVSTIIGDKFFPLYAPSSANLPYTVYDVFAVEHDHHMLAASGLAFNMFEFEHWALDSVTVGSMRETFRLALDGFVGELGGVDIRSIQLREDRETSQLPTDESQDTLFRASQEYSIIQHETVPTFPA